MKTKSGLLFAGLCGALSLASFQSSHAASPSLAAPPPANQAKMANPASSPPLTRVEALALIAAAKTYEAHPKVKPDGEVSQPKVMMPDFDIAVAPPPPRAESKPEAPTPGMVWVAGHYMPVKGEWRWVRGEWAVPALPISVWIQAKYDEEKKHWFPGYWQPDLPASGGAAAPASMDAKAAGKTNSGY